MNGRGTSGESPARLRRGDARAPRGRAAVAAGVVAALVTTLLVAVASVAAAPAASAAPGDYGTSGASVVGFPNTTPTATKPESKLWFAQGSWWAAMASLSTGGWSIHRLDRAAGTWIDTGVALDPRGATQSDVLWNGTHLFVASHAVATSSTATSTLEPSRLFRYSWTGSAWSLDPSFPVQITSTSSESLVIAQTDSGRIWATWTLNKRLYVAQTSGSADAPTVAFNAGFIPSMANLTATESTAATTLVSDDISTIASANGLTTVVWSNQVTGTTWSASRTDAGSTWTAAPVVSGTLMSDDHVNLRAIPGDAAGRLVLVLKTSRNDATVPVQTDPLIVAAVYSPASGTWATATVATVAESATRAISVVEPGTDEVHVFYTAPSTAGIVAFEGTVYEKTAPLSTLQFPSAGTPVLRDTANATMNNATSSKQPATPSSGVVVLAATASSPRYWFSADGGAVLPPAPTASFTASTTSGTAPLDVSFTDTSTGSPTSWSWSFGDGGTSSAQSPSHTFTGAGTYTVTLTASNAGGSTSASTTVVVADPAVPAPTASFTTSTTSGTAPLAVSFTDTSIGSPTSWSWSFGDGGTSTAQNPAHTFTSAGTYTVTLTASNAGGSTSASTTVVVSAPVVLAPTASFTASTISGTAPLAVSFTDTSTGSPTSWSWSFGDGGTSTAQNPSRTFSTPGTYTVTLTASNAGGSTSASRTIVVDAPPVGTPIDRVNAGGAALAGGWFADTAASPSPWVNAGATKLGLSSTTAAIDVSDPSIPVGTPAALFQTSRYDVSGGKNMIWSMPVLSAGTYRVRLYFSENYWTAAGKRAFDVTINGTKVLSRFDIYAAAGGQRRGVVKEFTVTSTTGTPLVITFGRISGLDNPQVNAIEVLS